MEWFEQFWGVLASIISVIGTIFLLCSFFAKKFSTKKIFARGITLKALFK